MADVLDVKKRLKRLLEQFELSTRQKQVLDAKRSLWRYTWVTRATVEFTNSKDSSEPLHVTTSTISAQGLDFRSHRMLERDCKVLITLEVDKGKLQILATVIHSTESVGMPITRVIFDLN